MEDTPAIAGASNDDIHEIQPRRVEKRKAVDYNARKRSGGQQTRFPRSGLPPTHGSRPISVKEGRSYHYTPAAPPRAVAALSRTLGRKLYPRKFGKSGWSKARSLAAILFVFLAAFFLSKRSSARRYMHYPKKGTKGGNKQQMGILVGNSTERDGNSAEEIGHGIDYPSPQNSTELDAVPNQPGVGDSDMASQQGDLKMRSGPVGNPFPVVPTGEGAKQDPGNASELSDESRHLINPSGSSREGLTDAKPSSLENFAADESNLQAGRLRQAQIAESDFPAAKSLRDSLRKDINEELEKVGERGIGSLPNTAGENSRREEYSPAVEAKKKALPKFEDVLMQQSKKWDVLLLKSDNPWRDLSGSQGNFGAKMKSSHAPPSVEIWSHKDVSVSKNFKFPYCRLYNACRSKSGRILLHKDLFKHREVLSRCGVISHDNFVLGSAASEAGINFVRTTSGERTRYLDLVDRHPLRRGATHFLADSLKTLFFIDAVHGAASSDGSLIEKKCLDTIGHRNGSCITELPSDIHPAIFIRKESFIDDLWVPHYMKMLASNATMKGNTALRYLNIYDLYPKMLPDQTEPVQCFRSITTSASMYGQVPASALTSANPFFSGNDIDRNPAAALPSSSGENDAACRLRVKLSDHLEGDSESTKGMQQMVELLKLKTGANENAKHQIALKLVLPANERVPFSKQVEHTQETDILVAPHGLPMVDALFLRSGSAIVEVHPFSFISHMFQGIGQQLGLAFFSISAEPDVEKFEDCLTRYNGNESAVDMSGLIHKMKLAAAAHLASAGNSTLHLPEGGPEYYELQEIKQCARRQRLRVSYERVAEEVWKASTGICQSRATHVAN